LARSDNWWCVPTANEPSGRLSHTAAGGVPSVQKKLRSAAGTSANSARVFAAWKREFKLPWREAGLPNHHDDEVDSDQ